MIKTTFLETSKKLKEAGWNKATAYNYCFHYITGGKDYVHRVFDGEGLTSCGCQYLKISSPSSDELLEELPAKLIDRDLNCRYVLTVIKLEGIFMITYSGNGINLPHLVRNESLPDALALMWLYLREEKYL